MDGGKVGLCALIAPVIATIESLHRSPPSHCKELNLDGMASRGMGTPAEQYRYNENGVLGSQWSTLPLHQLPRPRDDPFFSRHDFFTVESSI